MRKSFTAALIAASIIFAAAPAFAQQAYKFDYDTQSQIQGTLDKSVELSGTINKLENSGSDGMTALTASSVLAAAPVLGIDANALYPLVRNGSPRQKQAMIDFVKTMNTARRQLCKGLLGQ